MLQWEGSISSWLQEACDAQRVASSCWTLLSGCPLFGPKWSPSLCSVQFYPSLTTRNLFPTIAQKPDSKTKIPGGVHYSPHVTTQTTPKWVITKIFSSISKQLTLAWQHCASDATPRQGSGSGGGLSPWSSATETQCCSTQAADSFPGSGPRSLLLPHFCASRTAAAPGSAPEMLCTPRDGKKGTAGTKVFPCS